MTKDEETITITRERYESLVEDEETLQALQAGGVDNWEWYDESLSDLRKRRREDEG